MSDNETKTTLEMCDLQSYGFTTTLNAVYDWATAVVNDIKDQFGDADLNTKISAYRQFGHENVVFSVWGDKEKDSHDIVFRIGFAHNYLLNRPNVPDTTEALHMIGIVTSSLNSKSAIGSQSNEFNEYCTPDEWGKDHTNAKLYVKI